MIRSFASKIGVAPRTLLAVARTTTNIATKANPTTTTTKTMSRRRVVSNGSRSFSSSRGRRGARPTPRRPTPLAPPPPPTTTTAKALLTTSVEDDFASIKVAAIPIEGGARRYVSLPSSSSVPSSSSAIVLEDPADREVASRERVAHLYASRNVLFGAWARPVDDERPSPPSPPPRRRLADLCGPLVDAAVANCEAESGEQTQAMAAMRGLCGWVRTLLDVVENGSDGSESPAMERILKLDDDRVAYDAVKAVATGVPRPGHSVVGRGTYRDAEEAWGWLAREFAERELEDERGDSEIALYGSKGAVVVAVEHLADTSEEYLRSAGGTMARMYFV